MSAEEREQHQREVKPPNCKRIAEEAGQVVKDKYEASGLTAYRRVEEVGNSGTYVVKEGYVRRTELPNGKVLMQEIPTGTKPLDWAKNNR